MLQKLEELNDVCVCVCVWCVCGVCGVCVSVSVAKLEELKKAVSLTLTEEQEQSFWHHSKAMSLMDLEDDITEKEDAIKLTKAEFEAIRRERERERENARTSRKGKHKKKQCTPTKKVGK